ncbi:MAG: hypothetical protein IH840_16715 [Candidatus Heimdallarchaeota archaeon]|nr:hypothetical protein [Candidatus Heimdallarchaeota archaeon]
MSECTLDDCFNLTQDKFCTHHLLSLENLKTGFLKWKKAYGRSISQKKYLTQLIDTENMSSGLYIQEVAAYLLKNKIELNA